MEFTHTLIHPSGANDNEKVTYSRRMYGTERLFATVAETAGCGHIFFGSLAAFKSQLMSPSDLTELVKEAWMRTRFDAPWVAQRAFKDNTEPNSWIHSYETSSTSGGGVVESWANETIIWSDEVHSLADWEEILLSAYWKPGDGRFGMEWHIAKAPADCGGDFIIMASTAHWLGDGRGLLPVIDLMFKHLRNVITNSVLPARELPWGSEISRLSSAAVVAVPHNPEKVGVAAIPEPLTLKQFVRPMIESVNWQNLPAKQTDIKLSRRDTSALHAVCRNREVTVTALLNSLCILADIQTAFHVAVDEAALREIHEDFSAADVYVVQNNLADRRYLLSKSLPSVTAPGGFGNLVIQMLPSVHSMDDVRRIIRLPSISAALTIDTDCDAFWKGLVAGSDLAQKSNKKCTPEAFAANEHAIDAFCPVFDKAMYLTPGIGSTSIGRLSSFGLFESFRPLVAGPDPDSPFVLHQLAMGIRTKGPDCLHVMAMIWEYDGEITIHLIASPKWHGDKAWRFYETSVRNSLQQILKGSPRL